MPIDKTKFYQGLYESEIGQLQRLHSTDNLLVGVIGVQVGFSWYCIKIATETILLTENWSLLEYSFTSFFGLYIVAFTCTVYFLIKSIWPRERAYIASPRTWQEQLKGLEDYYESTESQVVGKRKANEEFAEILLNHYIHAGEVNRTFAIKKHAFQARAKYCSVSAVLLVLLISIPLSLMENSHAPRQANVESGSTKAPAKACASKDCSYSGRLHSGEKKINKRVTGENMSSEKNSSEKPDKTKQDPSSPTKPPVPEIKIIQATEHNPQKHSNDNKEK